MTRATLTPSTYVQHRYGGLYLVVGVAKSTEDSTQEVVIYQHVYPFEEKLWARPIDQWTEDRFTKLNLTEAAAIFSKDQNEFQAEIAHNKMRAAQV